jgi:hypothetical protein
MISLGGSRFSNDRVGLIFKVFECKYLVDFFRFAGLRLKEGVVIELYGYTVAPHAGAWIETRM